MTALLINVEGAAKPWRHDPVAMRQALELYDRVVHEAAQAAGGRVVSIRDEGEGWLCAFSEARRALQCSLEMQRALGAAGWRPGAMLAARIALHSGAEEHEIPDHFGPVVSRDALLLSVARPGEILVSAETAALLGSEPVSGGRLQSLGTRRLPDVGEPVEVFSVFHPDLAVPAAADEMPSTNLPGQTTHFIGREKEMRETRRRLEDTRLLTLTGPGGTGKTRMALQLGAEVLAAFPDGVFVVEFEAVRDPSDLPAALSDVLGVRGEEGRSTTASLTAYLRERRMLLIFDNCEHVVSAAAQLAAGILRYCPEIRILATSREPLGASGETISPVPPLSLPDLDNLPSLERLSMFEAVRLFIDRAQATQPQFCVTDGNAPAVAEICHRLDGIPLAIELAAARVKVLAPHEIADRLGDRFKLLSGGARTALPRQQTLRALVDWSHDLLSPEEQLLWHRLSIFSGSFSLEGAGEVCAGGGIEEYEVLDLLGQLIDKSIVLSDAKPSGTRYRLLETIRAYGLAKLDAAGAMNTMRERHLQWLVSMSRAVRAQVTDLSDVGAWAPLLQEADNAEAALQFAMTRPERGEALEVVSALAQHWFLISAALPQRVERLRAVLALPGSQGHQGPSTRALALGFTGLLADMAGQRVLAGELLNEALSVIEHSGPSRAREFPSVLFLLGQSAMGRNDFAQARSYFARLLTECQKAGEQVFAYWDLAMMALAEGDLPAARQAADAAYAMGRDSNPYGSAVAHWTMAEVLLVEGHLTESERLMDAALAGMRTSNSTHNVADALTEIESVYRLQGRTREAVEALSEALRITRKALFYNRMAVEEAAMLCAGADRFADAAELFGAAEAVGVSAKGPTTRHQEEEWAKTRAAVAKTLGETAYEGLRQGGLTKGLSEVYGMALEALTRLSEVSSVETEESLTRRAPVRVNAVPEPAAAARTQARRAAENANPALAVMRSMARLALSELAVVGSYRRHDERVRNQLRDWRRLIAEPMLRKTSTHENFLIWAAPGSGKSFLIQETARALGDVIRYFELNLARLPREEFLEGLQQVRECRQPLICLLDEIDARADESWVYEEAFSLLDLNLQPDRQATFILIGSHPKGLEAMVAAMTARSKGKDMLDRVPVSRRFQIPAPTLEDRAVIVASQVLDAAGQRGEPVDEVERLALYYALTDDSLQTPRQLRDLAVAAVQNLPSGERRLKYDDLFFRGDSRSKQFWVQHQAAAEELTNVFVRLEA